MSGFPDLLCATVRKFEIKEDALLALAPEVT